MIAVKTDDAIYMNVDSFFAGDGLSSMGEGLYLGCGDAGFGYKEKRAGRYDGGCR